MDRAFQVTIKRKVKNDSTVSINSQSYECPHRFIGKTVEIRFPSDKPHHLIIYQDDKPVVQLKQVQPYQNANIPAWGIRFNKEEENENEENKKIRIKEKGNKQKQKQKQEQEQEGDHVQ